jgi:hypothetical protein
MPLLPRGSILLLALAAGGLSALAAPEAQARERTRTRTASQVDGARRAATHASASASGVNGGAATRQGSVYRNVDGSAGRQGSASINGTDGGSARSSGGFDRSADGSVTGSRQTSASAATGARSQGSTTVADGSVSHTGTCTNAASEVVACHP